MASQPSLFVRIFAKDDASATLAKVDKGLGSLAGPLGSLATQSLGLTGPLGEVAKNLGVLGLGGGVAGIAFAGISALVGLFGQMKEEAKDAARETDDLVKRLNEAADLEANPFAREVKTLTALNAEVAALDKKIKDVESSPISFGQNTARAATDAENLERTEKLRTERLSVIRAIEKQNRDIKGEILKDATKLREETERTADAAAREADARRKAAEALAAPIFARQRAQRLEAGGGGNSLTGGAATTTGLNAGVDAANTAGVPGFLQGGSNKAMVAALQGGVGETKPLAEGFAKQMSDQFEFAIADALGNGIANGFAAVFQSGSIGEGFKQLTGALLGGLGQAMVAFGKQALAASTLMSAIQKGLSSFLPGGAVVASIAMIALGSALSGLAASAARSFSGGAASGSALSTSASAISAETAAPITFVVPRELSMQPSDPRIQDWFAETLRQATGRRVIVETA